MADTSHPRFWNVPNIISVGRLALSMVVFGLIAGRLYLAGLVVFLIASISDAFDGYIARRLNQVTSVGRQLDPLVDKVMVAGAFIYLLSTPRSGIGAWMVTTIVVRELLIQGLRSLLEGRGEAFGARTSGKIKTVLQCVAISASLIALSIDPAPAWIVQVRDIVIWLAVGLTIYSGVVYFAAAWPMLRGDPPPAAS